MLTPCADGLFFAVRQAHSSALIALSAVASSADARELDALYLKIHQRAALPLGLYGALLPVLLVPSGVTLARAFGVFRFEAALTVPFAAIVITAYYLVWKHIVAYLNHEMGIG